MPHIDNTKLPLWVSFLYKLIGQNLILVSCGLKWHIPSGIGVKATGNGKVIEHNLMSLVGRADETPNNHNKGLIKNQEINY